MGEFDVIRWIRERAEGSPRIVVGIGDDCAVISTSPDKELLVTTDMLMDGRHFRMGEATLQDIGYKALAVNLSDIAAMAGTPIAAQVAVALPRSNAKTIAKGLFEGMAPLAERFGVVLSGGDTNGWDGPLVISITLLGEIAIGGAIRRSGARVGDAIVVTGSLGGSLLGRHLRPQPRVAEALAIRELVDIHAMIDISDGLASDLAHILDESGNLGAILDLEAIPVHADAQTMAKQDGRTAIDHALNDGEDFELCFTVDADEWRARGPTDIGTRVIGIITPEPGLRLRESGRETPIAPRGFDHLS